MFAGVVTSLLNAFVAYVVILKAYIRAARAPRFPVSIVKDILAILETFKNTSALLIKAKGIIVVITVRNRFGDKVT